MTTTAPATAIRGELQGVPESRVSPRSEFELREVPNGTGGTNLRFTGFASVTGDAAAYEMEDWMGPWTESVTPGAFKRTLAGNGPDTVFLINHAGLSLARTRSGTLKLSEETDPSSSPISGITGLYSEAHLDPQNMYVQAVRSGVERGDLSEMSFAFRVVRQTWSDDYDRRRIQEVTLDKGDVSIVTFGANPATGDTVSIRQRPSGLAPGRRAATPTDSCNRCGGGGTIMLKGKGVTCPQCEGSGGPENNSSDNEAQNQKWISEITRSRIMLEKLRYPPVRQ